jgi:hypothetical protein
MNENIFRDYKGVEFGYLILTCYFVILILHFICRKLLPKNWAPKDIPFDLEHAGLRFVMIRSCTAKKIEYIYENPAGTKARTVMQHLSKTMKGIKAISTRTISTIILVIGLLIVYLLPTDYLFENKNTLCIHKILFDFECPGCGMTRALNLALHGSFKEAATFNAAVIPFLIVVIAYLLGYLSSNKIILLTYKYSLIFFTITILIQYIFKTMTHFNLI